VVVLQTERGGRRSEGEGGGRGGGVGDGGVERGGGEGGGGGVGGGGGRKVKCLVVVHMKVCGRWNYLRGR